MTYATDRIREEVAYIAYHFHWPLDDILDLEHRERLHYVEAISELNRRSAEGG